MTGGLVLLGVLKHGLIVLVLQPGLMIAVGFLGIADMRLLLL